MELVVGTNCYADIAEYNELIADNFMSTNPIRVFWEALSESDKKSLIVGSTSKYDKDSFYYKGYKQSKTQPLQFPRYLNSDEQFVCPDKVKLGILLNGCRESMNEGTTEAEMIANGVKSFADGTGARIEFGDTSSKSVQAMRTTDGVYGDIWETYFKEYTLLE